MDCACHAHIRGSDFADHHHLCLLYTSRELLYEQGFTISGARNRLDGAEVLTCLLYTSGA